MVYLLKMVIFHGYVSPNQMVYGFIWIYYDLTDCAPFPQAMPGLICADARSNHLVHHVHHVFPFLLQRFARQRQKRFSNSLQDKSGANRLRELINEDSARGRTARFDLQLVKDIS